MRIADDRSTPRIWPNATSLAIEPCLDPHCLDCHLDLSLCAGCNSTQLYFLNVSTQACTHRDNILPTQGIDWATLRIVPCASAGCLNCFDNVTACLACDVPSGYFLNETLNACVHFSGLPPGIGGNKVTGGISNCLDAVGCSVCLADYTVCEQCAYTQGYFMNTTTSSCMNASQIPLGFGGDLVGYGLLPCAQSTTCYNCSTNNLLCTSCLAAQGYYLYPQTGQCMNTTSFPPLHGINTVNFTVDPCTSTGCTNCTDDASVCRQCDATSGYLLRGDTMQCILATGVPTGMGMDNSTNSVRPCLTANCIDCKYDYTFCTSCNLTSQSCYDIGNQQCIAFSSIDPNAGCNLATGQLSSCKIEGCVDCKEDHLKCNKCDMPMGYFMENGSCRLNSTLPAGMGFDPSRNMIVGCASPGCLDCRYDTTSCSYCGDPTVYKLKDGWCVSAKNDGPKFLRAYTLSLNKCDL